MLDYPQNADLARHVFDVESVILSGRLDHNTGDGRECWCCPDVEHNAGGDLVIHREPGGTDH